MDEVKVDDDDYDDDKSDQSGDDLDQVKDPSEDSDKIIESNT